MTILGSLLIPISAEAIIGLIVLVILLFFSALISGSEIAFFSLGPAHINELNRNTGKKDEMVLSLIKIPKRLLATILITNNFINVSIVILATYLITELFNLIDFPILAFLIQAVVITALILIIGEIMPKILATQKPIKFAHIMAVPLRILINVFYPMSTLLINSTSFIDKRISGKGHQISRSELSEAIEITTDDDNIGLDERKILQGIVRFGDIGVKEIMKSRTDLIAVDQNINFDELLNIILESGYSRIPVYKDSLDYIVGVLYIKDLLSHLKKEKNFHWQKLIRSAFFIPENKKINDLLKEFQEKKVHLAIVVDEYGGTSGIATLEDVLEEIIGDISDEFDAAEDEVLFTKIDDKNYIFEGKTTLIDFCKIIGEDENIFDNVKGDSDSLAGLILEILGKIPLVEENVQFKNFNFIVKDVDKRRIKKIKIIIEN
ncbi:MAG: gliding motility-associated protein GldE [Bacteroidetes bacterium]|nr:gliding motility-associated protein GldE [Bacteroidota bacterium]